ncbi:MAG: hypothetical protein IT476_10090, partial [Rhodanobacteraceae bacterium]|nr:hypothetical protein [Rhodanobacteraceae bacterium]
MRCPAEPRTPDSVSLSRASKLKTTLSLPYELDHIVLRKLHTGDLDAFLAYRTDP